MGESTVSPEDRVSSLEIDTPSAIGGQREARSAGSLPNYLGGMVLEAQSTLLSYDISARAGDTDQASHWAERTAGLVCLGLERMLDEFDFPALEPEQELALLRGLRESKPQQGWGRDFDRFRDQEVALLQLVGLSQDLARREFDELTHLYRGAGVQAGGVEDRFDSARRAVCQLHSRLATDRQRSAQRQRGRRRLEFGRYCPGWRNVVSRKRCVRFQLITPVGAAASAWLGAGAAGAVVNLVND